MPSFFETVPQPIFAAEFDYFRLGRERWGLMLTRLGQLGVSTLVLTVPWGFHEVEAGSIDLEGNSQPRRDLVGLLDLSQRLGFQCLLKLAPTHPDQGLLREGLPAWLAQAETQEGLRPAFERWLKSVSRTLAGRQWPDGPIVALWVEGQAPAAPEALPEQLTEVRWPIWLRKRYKGIEALNEVYGTDYRTVGDVVFPQDWRGGTGPLAEDARAFLAENRQEHEAEQQQVLQEGGWQIPIRTPESPEALPSLQVISLAEPLQGALPEVGEGLVILRHPFQVEPVPIEAGVGPVWAERAPIRSDGSLRGKFWTVRAWLWPRKLVEATAAEGMVTVPAENGTFITGGQDMLLKLSLAKGSKPQAFRLSMSGALEPEAGLVAARGKLNGLYRAAGEAEQTDGVLLVSSPAAPLTGFSASYLQRLLAAQAEALAQAAALATHLGQSLAAEPERPPSAQRQTPAKPLPYTLAEARRGLREADAALRKAVASIGGLEVGFNTILGRRETDPAQAAAPPPAIHPEVFEGATRALLLETGRTCQTLAPRLHTTAESVKQVAEGSEGLTVAQYQQAYATATETAREGRQTVLPLVERLRAEIAAEALPLVAWRVHDQVQALAETLRWGVGCRNEE